jgi:hypothetical protein
MYTTLDEAISKLGREQVLELVNWAINTKQYHSKRAAQVKQARKEYHSKRVKQTLVVSKQPQTSDPSNE